MLFFSASNQRGCERATEDVGGFTLFFLDANQRDAAPASEEVHD